MKKSKVIWGFIIFIFMSVIVGFLVFIRNVREDTKNHNEVMDEILEEYSKLEENIEKYNQLRASYTESFQNIYMENLKSDYSKIVELLLKLDENIESDKDIVDNIRMACLDRVFSKNKVNTICSSYSEYYERLVNVYWNDILKFNQVVNNYNGGHEDKLEEYVSVQVTDYIDYNQDGKYLEKSEES